MTPFEPVLVEFCDSLSQQLFAEAEHPELVALAYWLRRSHLEELQERFTALKKKGELIVPRGMAFHIAPANVETLFVYSWILSLLVGNGNVVRLPSRQSKATTLLFSILERLLADPVFEKIAKSTRLLSYGHEEAITAAISKEADVRLIWGGDATIETIRKIPLKVTGKELLFADRYAFAAFKASYYLEASAAQQQIAELFYRDLFWYDQQTCASPRTVIWVGSSEVCQKASQNLYKRLQEIVKARKYTLPLAARLHKMAEIYRAAIALSMRKVHNFEALSVIELDQFTPECRSFGGFGLLLELAVPELEAITDSIIQKDQTLVHAGFTEAELNQLAVMLNGRGLDRLVPVGRALQFEAVWDGYDLMAELTRRVVVEHE